MDIVAVHAMFVVAIAAEGFILNRARKRAEYEDAVSARLARYAGRHQ